MNTNFEFARNTPIYSLSPSVMVKRGHRNLMLIPIAFVNEHIETLHELDIEYADEVGRECGAEKIARCPTPNDHPAFVDAMADVVSKHLSQVSWRVDFLLHR